MMPKRGQASGTLLTAAETAFFQKYVAMAAHYSAYCEDNSQPIIDLAAGIPLTNPDDALYWLEDGLGKYQTVRKLLMANSAGDHLALSHETLKKIEGDYLAKKAAFHAHQKQQTQHLGRLFQNKPSHFSMRKLTQLHRVYKAAEKQHKTLELYARFEEMHKQYKQAKQRYEETQSQVVTKGAHYDTAKRKFKEAAAERNQASSKLSLNKNELVACTQALIDTSQDTLPSLAAMLARIPAGAAPADTIIARLRTNKAIFNQVSASLATKAANPGVKAILDAKTEYAAAAQAWPSQYTLAKNAHEAAQLAHTYMKHTRKMSYAANKEARFAAKDYTALGGLDSSAPGVYKVVADLHAAEQQYRDTPSSSTGMTAKVGRR